MITENNVKHILEIILNNISKFGKIDFSVYEGVVKGKPTNAQYHVICIEVFFKRTPREYGFTWDKQAFVYNGSYWQGIEDKTMENFLLDFAINLGVPWLSQKHYKQKESLLKQFTSSAPIIKTTSDYVLNVLNGTLRFLPEPTLTDFDKDDFLKYQRPFSYNEASDIELFQFYLDRCLPDKSAQKVLAEYSEYLFISKKTLNLEKFLLLYGTGANGKSVFFDVINALLGSKNVTNYSLENLCNENGHYRAKIKNVLLNYCTEVSGNKIQSTNHLKSMASGEPMEARLLYQDPIIIERYAKLIFNVNNLPITSDLTDGFFRRFLVIPFSEVIPLNERDTGLAQKIINKELSGVLNWVIDGLTRLLRNGKFTESKSMAMAIKQYQYDADTVLAYLSETETSKGSHTTTGSDLYNQYKEYCIDCGNPPIGKSKFFQMLERKGFQRVIKNKQIHFGIHRILEPVKMPYKNKYFSEQEF